MSSDAAAAETLARPAVVQRPHRRRGGRVADPDARRTTPQSSREFRRAHAQFQDFAARSRSRDRSRSSPQAAPRMGRTPSANRAMPQSAERGARQLAQVYAQRAKRDLRGDRPAYRSQPRRLITLLAALAVMLAAAGAVIDPTRDRAAAADHHTGHRSGCAGDAPRSPSPTASAATRSAHWHARSRCSRTPCDAMRSWATTVIDDAAGARAPPGADVERRSTHFSAEVEATLAELGRISRADAGGLGRLSGAADNAAERTDRRRRRFGRCFRQCARHRVRGGRARRLGGGDRPASGAVECHRGQGGERSRAHQRDGQGAQRSRRAASATWSA